MTVKDKEDIVTIYSDYLLNRRYHVIARYTRGNNIKTVLERHSPDVNFIMLYYPEKNRIGVATEILDVYPGAPILFVIADYRQPQEIEKDPIFQHKSVSSAQAGKTDKIEEAILQLVNDHSNYWKICK